MVKKKKQEIEEVEEEYPGELKGEGFIEELDEEKQGDEVREIDASQEEDWKKYFESFQVALVKQQEVITKHQEVISINQKYIKKIWERVKQNEDNFKTLLEKIQ